MGLVRHILSYWYPELLATASLENPATPLSEYDRDEKALIGIDVTEESALGVGAYFACLKVLGETMASMDLEVVEKVGKATRVNTSHKNYWLLHAEPSPHYSRFEWVQAMVIWAASWGNGYSRIKRDRFANAIELELLPSYLVTPKMNERGRLYYEYQNERGRIEVIMADDIIHLKNIGTNGIVGMSTAQIQRETIGAALAKIQQEGSFYVNGAKASGVLMTPGTMGVKERSNVIDSFKKATEGPQNRFKTILLEEGVKYQQLTIPQNDAQFLESKKFDRTDICGWFRMPPHKIGELQDANYSNIESQDRSFAKDVAVPWATRFQLELDRKLFFQGERGRFMTQFNLDDLIKGDIKTRYEVYGMAIDHGMLKPTEPREAEGWPMENTDEIDQFFMNSTMKPVKQIVAEAVNPSTQQPDNQDETRAA